MGGLALFNSLSIVAQLKAGEPIQLTLLELQFDAAIGHTEREIVLLREYRTRLITDVVTGKLDVREAARILPIEADDPEALIESDSPGEGEESFDGDATP